MGKIAFRLAELIGDLDERVFKDKPTVVSIIPGSARKFIPTVGCGIAKYFFLPKNEYFNDVYGIFMDRDKMILKCANTAKFYRIRKDPGNNNTCTITMGVSATLNDCLMALAAHEVRHRAQQLLPLTFISPKDELNVKDLYLRVLILSNKKLFRRQIFTRKIRSIPYKAREFDANVIGWWAAKIWHDTKNLSKVAEIIKADAGLFLKKGGRNNLPPNFYTGFLLSNISSLGAVVCYLFVFV